MQATDINDHSVSGELDLLRNQTPSFFFAVAFIFSSNLILVSIICI